MTAQNPGHTIYFPPCRGRDPLPRLLRERSSRSSTGRRPIAHFRRTPTLRRASARTSPVDAALYYRVFAMNDSRIGPGGPVAVSPPGSSASTTSAGGVAGAAFGLVNDDDCLDLPTALGSVNTGVCAGSFTARDLDDVGPRGPDREPAQGRATCASRTSTATASTKSSATSRRRPATPDSIALLHVNQGDGNYQTSAAVSALAIGGFGGTLLAADFDNDGDVDLFAPNDQTRGDGARNWLLDQRRRGRIHGRRRRRGRRRPIPPAPPTCRAAARPWTSTRTASSTCCSARACCSTTATARFSDGSVAANVPVLADEGLKLIDVDLDGDFDLIHHDGVDDAPVPQHGRRVRRRRTRRRRRRCRASASG